jgi:hypothetical protein
VRLRSDECRIPLGADGLPGNRQAGCRVKAPIIATGKLPFDNGMTTVQVSLTARADGGQKCRPKPLRRTSIVVGMRHASDAAC